MQNISRSKSFGKFVLIVSLAALIEIGLTDLPKVLIPAGAPAL